MLKPYSASSFCLPNKNRVGVAHGDGTNLEVVYNKDPHICKNLPYGLGLRLRVIISEQETLELRLKELSAFLTARGYSEGLVAKAVVPLAQKRQR